MTKTHQDKGTYNPSGKPSHWKHSIPEKGDTYCREESNDTNGLLNRNQSTSVQVPQSFNGKRTHDGYRDKAYNNQERTHMTIRHHH